MKQQILLEPQEVQMLVRGEILTFEVGGQHIEVRAELPQRSPPPIYAPSETRPLARARRALKRCSYCKRRDHRVQNCPGYQKQRRRENRRRLLTKRGGSFHCPECRSTWPSAQRLGMHRSKAHRVAGEKARRTPRKLQGLAALSPRRRTQIARLGGLAKAAQIHGKRRHRP
jgi:hypothetical protein